MINKIARTIEMSFDIPDSEKQVGEESEELFKKVLAILDQAKKHLDEMYEPFKEAASLSSDKLYDIRGIVFRYKEQIKKNFENVKRAAKAAVIKFNHFQSDTHALELINTFQGSFGEMEDQVNVLLDVLSDVKADDFKEKYVAAVETILEQRTELENLINDRIIDYIDSNILAKNWMTDVAEETESHTAERVPYITQLFHERQQALDS